MNFRMTMMTMAAVMAACTTSRHNEWEDLDYSAVYRAAGQRDNDRTYVQPSVLGCVNEDLYNCH
jgi:hypothetical protein